LCRHQLLEEAAHDFLIEEPLPVFGERVGLPDQMIWDQTHIASEQQVEEELLQQ